MADQYGNYTVMDGVLNDTPEQLLQEVKDLVEMKVKEDMTAEGVNVNEYQGTHVIQQWYRDENHNGWSEPLIGIEIPCITIGYKMARKVIA